MTRPYRLTKVDSEDIGFVLACLIASAITFSEVNEWHYFVIQYVGNVPNYFFDILDLEGKSGYTLRRQSVTSYFPSWESSLQEENALDGITCKRNANHKRDVTNLDVRLESLE